MFLSWTQTNIYATEYDQNPLTAAPDASVLLREVTVLDADVTVYALWAADQNANGVPDYDETLVTISFDANGSKDPSTGADGSLDPITGLLPGTMRSLPGPSTIKWIKDWNGGSSPAVFADWSPVRMNGIVDQNGIYRGYSVNDILVREPYPVPSGSVTLYAVYAADEDNDGVPDYQTNAVHVEYYANGGQAADSHITVEADGHFFTCGHHHVPGQPDVALLTAEETGHMIRREGSIFLGWSLKAGVSPCRSAADVEAAGIVSTVNMPASGNLKVYAVWAEDINDNGTEDYLEPHYHHSYYLNTQLSTWVDDPEKPYEQNTPPLDGVLPEGVARIVIGGHEIRTESDAAKAAAELLPAPESDILVGDYRRLADNDLLGDRTDYDADGSGIPDYIDPSPSPSPSPSASPTSPTASAAPQVPDTGDTSHAALWAGLLVLCSGALAWVLRRRRRCRS